MIFASRKPAECPFSRQLEVEELEDCSMLSVGVFDVASLFDPFNLPDDLVPTTRHPHEPARLASADPSPIADRGGGPAGGSVNPAPVSESGVGPAGPTLPPGSSPGLLLSDAVIGSLVAASTAQAPTGSQPGSLIRVSRAPVAGPLYPCCGVSLTPSSTSIPVNADDDNRSPITNGIPAERDFDVAPLPYDDPDLVQATVSWNGPLTGSWSMQITNRGSGRISLWTTDRKDAAFNVPTGQEASFYIEGDHESGSVGDITLTFTYTIPQGDAAGSYSASVTLTVTPVITGFSATAGGGATGQNVFFANGVNGMLGLTTASPQNVPGVSFSASVQDAELPGDLEFIQNMETDPQNGYNSSNDTGHGATFKPGTTPQFQNFLLLVTAPVLDTSAAQAANRDPTYPLATSNNNNGVYTITSNDSPSTGAVASGKGGVQTAFDVYETFTLYLTWRFNNYRGYNFYTLAKITWWVNFYGTATGGNSGVGPVNTINALRGVTAQNFYSPSNFDPGSTNTNEIANGNLVWAAAS